MKFHDDLVILRIKKRVEGVSILFPVGTVKSVFDIRRHQGAGRPRVVMKG